jgi:hypothetical protein
MADCLIRAKASRNKEHIPAYLEIYIEDNGRAIITPVTKEIFPFLEKISQNRKEVQSIYCG